MFRDIVRLLISLAYGTPLGEEVQHTVTSNVKRKEEKKI
tara:strand:- start:551 stop:667 length:117 start_codon:yes stop_codon:yes gene_type:complete